MKLPMMLKLLHKLEQLRRHETWSRAQLEAYQAAALRQMRDYAYARSPFYQRYHDGKFDRPLSELPVLTKSMMMENFDRLVTDPSLRLEDVRAFAVKAEPGQRFQNRYWVNATSGSSGHPGFFLFDEEEWLNVLASFARSQEWSGVRIDLTHRLVVKVPVQVVGEAKGVKVQGGLLEVIVREVEIECLPDEIPEHFTVDVTELMIGQSKRAADIPMTESIRLVSQPEAVVAHVVALRAEAEPTPAAEAAPAVAEPEVIKKGKKEEEAVPETKEKKK